MRKLNEKFEFELGAKAQDTITGFIGIITGATRYITGCDIYQLAPPTDDNGKHIEARWYDDNRIKILKSKKVVLREQKNQGACEYPPVK